MSINKYLFFTIDQQLIDKLSAVFQPRQIQFKDTTQFPEVEEGVKLVVIDGDHLPPAVSMQKIKLLKRKKIPVVYIFNALDGKEVVEVLKQGVVSVLFKDYTASWIKSELRDILYNFNYLEKVKEIAENDNRTRKFLAVVNSLTSDNDISKIMNDILGSMTEVFKLESTFFFIRKKNRLAQKIKLGYSMQDYSEEEWDLKDKDIKWLARIQHSKTPVYITEKSPKEYTRTFPANTLLLPLVIKEKFFGLITTTLPSGANRLTRHEIGLLKAFAQQTAVALENARLYWDVIKAREELVHQEKRNLMNQTIVSLNHEINNPLSVISMEAQLLQQRHNKNENKMESRIAKIEKNIDRIKHILEKISALNVEEFSPIEYIPGQNMINLHEN